MFFCLVRERDRTKPKTEQNNNRSLFIPQLTDSWKEIQSELKCASQREKKVVELIVVFFIYISRSSTDRTEEKLEG